MSSHSLTAKVPAIAVALVSLLVVTLGPSAAPVVAVPPSPDADPFTSASIICKVLRTESDAVRGVVCQATTKINRSGEDRDVLVSLPNRAETRVRPGSMLSVPGHQEVQPSQTKTVGGIVCTGLPAGVSCVNLGGHGFVVIEGKFDRETGNQVTPDTLRRF